MVSVLDSSVIDHGLQWVTEKLGYMGYKLHRWCNG